jgi:deoxycytidylate deaminase
MLHQTQSIIGEDYQIMMDILHGIDHVPHNSTSCMKDINVLKKTRTSAVDASTALLNTVDMKNVLRLKRQIQRSGLVLARHAEENALEKYISSIGIKGRKAVARRKLHVVVIRINNENEITESKPCSHCVEVMRSYGIRKVTYSTRDGKLITESLTLIVTQPSVGYRSVERAINVLDEMVNFYASGIG